MSASDLRTLASEKCKLCSGWGMVATYHGGHRLCYCVYRQIFRACLSVCLEIEAQPVTQWGSVATEYCADVRAIAKRILSAIAFRLFELYHLGEAEYLDCLRQLPGLDRGVFWHHVYKIERELGMEFQRAGLYPAHRYFGQVRPPVSGGYRRNGVSFPAIAA